MGRRTGLEARLQKWEMEIPGWRPTLLNEMMGRHPMKVHARKAEDFRQIAMACLVYEVPRAEGRRRVMVRIGVPRGRFPDPDAPLKSLLDALKRAGAILDDSSQYCRWERPEFYRGPRSTTIILEEFPAGLEAS